MKTYNISISPRIKQDLDFSEPLRKEILESLFRFCMVTGEMSPKECDWIMMKFFQQISLLPAPILLLAFCGIPSMKSLAAIL